VAPTQDEAFHEIQLNGKQLVFLFMAATVVSVVIFLCGVLVGRNVRTEPVGVDVSASGSEPVTPVPAPQAAPPEAPPAYTDLDKTNPKPQPLKKIEAAPKAESEPVTKAPATLAERAPVAVSPAEPATPPAEKPAPRPSATAGTADPTGQGFAVQIAAVNARSEADAMAKRLMSKGYSAYVLAPASGTPSVYRVRVGKFPTRREAETVAAKLQKEEQLKPWVTR
jgi:DedD protein